MRHAGYVVLTFELFEEDGQWVGRCRELGTAICADTLAGANDDLHEAVSLHLNTLEKVGERKRFFKNHGIKLYRASESPSLPRPRVPLNGFVSCQTVAVPA